MALPILLLACSASTGETADSNADSLPGDSSLPLDTSPTEAAASLAGLRWELPCLQDTSPELCTTSTTLQFVAVMAGEAGTTYAVPLRFRGVVEPKTYTGGTPGAGWNLGGTPAADTANIYRLTLSDPAATYYLNAGTTRASDELYAEALDYTFTASIAAGATVTLAADSLDALQIRNIDATGQPIVIEDVPPAPEAYDGQFIQMDVGL